VLKTIGAAASGAAITTLMPGRWIKPIIRVGLLPAHAQTSASATYEYSATAQSIQNLNVPNGVIRITIEVWGAQGGGGSSYNYFHSTGGRGGYASGELSVSSGDILFMAVGFSGDNGGWPGGGSAGNGADYSGYDGGGFSMVALNSPTNYILIAGGGGGAGGRYTPVGFEYPSGAGGYGGGSTGNNGINGEDGGSTSNTQGYGGGGGTASAGGAGGTGLTDNGSAGTAMNGLLQNGGDGGGGGNADGGGYYGGGGGGNGYWAGGGGGGSGFVSGSLSNTSLLQSQREGNGLIHLTW
jgi:hypothetical protein